MGLNESRKKELTTRKMCNLTSKAFRICQSCASAAYFKIAISNAPNAI